MADRPPSERLIALFGRLRDLNTPVSDLDEVFWAHARRVEHPLTRYDLETYEACRRVGDPIARAVSDPGALLRHLEEAWPGGQLTLSNRTGVLTVQVLIPGLGVGVSGGFRGGGPALRDRTRGRGRLRPGGGEGAEPSAAARRGLRAGGGHPALPGLAGRGGQPGEMGSR